MPIRSSISTEARPEALKASLALIDKYQAALKKQYGDYVAFAPYIKAASGATADMAKYLQREEVAARAAAATQARFTGAAQKAGNVFGHLASNVKLSIENLARYALSPLQILFPAGLTVGLFGLGAGLLGAGVFGLGGYALDRAAYDVSSRRRTAMGLGLSYGSLSAYELNFERFGLGDRTLAGVATGVYDVTSPEYLGLLTSGAATGDTASAAIALIRQLPHLLAGIPDQSVGAVARSRGWTNLLDLSTIIRLKNASPEEVQKQIDRYNADRRTLDISVQAQRKWADFDVALARAGQKIETVLGSELAPLADPLSHLSDSMVRLIDAFAQSGVITKGLDAAESGLQALSDTISSSTFKQDGKLFLSGLQRMSGIFGAPGTAAALAGIYLLRGLPGGSAFIGALAARGLGAATIWLLWKEIFGNSPPPGANEGLRRTLGLIPENDEVPPVPHVNYDLNPSGKPSIRYGTRGAGGPTVDSMTGKIVHEFHGMPYPKKDDELVVRNAFLKERTTMAKWAHEHFQGHENAPMKLSKWYPIWLKSQGVNVHAAAGVDPHKPAGHLTVYDYTGGSVTVTTSPNHTAQ